MLPNLHHPCLGLTHGLTACQSAVHITAIFMLTPSADLPYSGVCNETSAPSAHDHTADPAHSARLAGFGQVWALGCSARLPPPRRA
jgi:hypothetical protein